MYGYTVIITRHQSFVHQINALLIGIEKRKLKMHNNLFYIYWNSLISVWNIIVLQMIIHLLEERENVILCSLAPIFPLGHTREGNEF